MPTHRSTGQPGPRHRRLPAARPGAALALVLLVVGPALPAGAAEPFSDWLDGLGEAAERAGGGDAAGALAAARRALAALPEGQAGARASAAVGLALLRSGQAETAVAPLRAALAAPGGAEPGDRPALDLALGEALLATGRHAEAAEALSRAAAGAAPQLERLGRRARWLECRALSTAGLLPQAAAGLEALLREAPGDEEAWAGRLALAGVHRALGRAGRAFALYRALALEEPDRPEGTAALEALERWRAAGGPVPAPSGDDRLARAERLLARGHHAAALAELDLAASATPPAPAQRLAVQRAMVVLGQGRHAEAEALARPLAAEGPPAGVRRSATLILARTAARAGRTEAAVKAYQEVAALPGGFAGLPEPRWRDLADEAAYLAAWLWYDAGHIADAGPRLEGFARAHPASRRVDDARWFAAWAHVRLGERVAARRALARLEGGPLADAALYWQGRLATSATAAAGYYRKAVTAGADGWYAALARARLKAAGLASTGTAAAISTSAPTASSTSSSTPTPTPTSTPTSSSTSTSTSTPTPTATPTSTPTSSSIPTPEPLAPLTLPDGPAGQRLQASAALLALGLRDAARAELSDLLRRRPAAAVAAPLAELAAFAGEADLPFRTARDHLGTTRRTARWLYPDPLPALAPLAAQAGVDPDLLRAVIRKESAFRPDARSAAGAIGLLQLVPPTAARLAALAGLPTDPPPRLLDPETSVALGAHYLALLLDRFHGEAAALAAYNAGPARAADWARDRAGLPLDEWVEAIPYKETRGYVKAVLAAREAYRRLAGRPPDLDPARPVEAPGPGVAF
jgi:peptidoglycan lytic transglycosylase